MGWCWLFLPSLPSLGRNHHPNQTVKEKKREYDHNFGPSYSIRQSFAIFLQVLIEYKIHIFPKLLDWTNFKICLPPPILHPWTCDWYIIFALSVKERKIQHGWKNASSWLFTTSSFAVSDNNRYSNLNTRHFGRRDAYHNGQLGGRPNDAHTRFSENNITQRLPKIHFCGISSIWWS